MVLSFSCNEDLLLEVKSTLCPWWHCYSRMLATCYVRNIVDEIVGYQEALEA